MSIKVRLYEGELLQAALRRFRCAVIKGRGIPYHKKLIKDLVTRGQKQRQKELSAALRKRRIQYQTNPNHKKGV